MIHDKINGLKKEITIPEVVQQKADAAFTLIQKDAANTAKDNPVVPITNGRKQPSHRTHKRKLLLAVLAAVLALGTINVAAAYLNRSKSLGEELHITDEQQIQLEEKNISTFANQSSTDQGITITALQSITDNYYTHIAFRVEGYQVAPGVQPAFEITKITVDGQSSDSASFDNGFSYSGGFFNGLVPGDDGRAVSADGYAPLTDADGNVMENYTMADGSMELNITLFNSKIKGYFINKPIQVEFKNLGTVSKAEFQPDRSGAWSFDWNLTGSSELKECSLNAPLGDSGATVVKAELSPISLKVIYNLPRKEIEETVKDENGKETTMTYYAEPPQLTGVRLKDGTLYPNLFLGPGSMGYESETTDNYLTTFAIDRILDVEQIESLLFFKPYVEGASAEDSYYFVPVQ